MISPYELIAKFQKIDEDIISSLTAIKDKTKLADLEDVRLDIARLINKVSRICR